MFCQFTDGEHFLAGGFGKLIHETCLAEGAVSPDDPYTQKRKLGSISIVSEKLKCIYDDLIRESGAEVSFFTKVIDVMTSGKHIDYVICSGRSSIFAVKAKVYVDCTGDGVMACYAGADYEKGDENGRMQAGTLCSFWTNIDWDKARKNQLHGDWPRNERYLEQAVQDGVLSVYDRHLPGMWRTGETTGGGNIGHLFGIDGTDEVSLTNGMLEGRHQLKEYEAYYRNYLKGFENAAVVDTGALMGIRETRRILGDYILSAEDYYNRACFPDEIGRYNYSIDFHASNNTENEQNARKDLMAKSNLGYGESYGIPYRCLTPRGFDNLLTAGRCISCDRYVQASVRVMPGCFITGQAAGMAASLCAEQNKAVNGIDTQMLREELKKLGAYFP